MYQDNRTSSGTSSTSASPSRIANSGLNVVSWHSWLCSSFAQSSVCVLFISCMTLSHRDYRYISSLRSRVSTRISHRVIAAIHLLRTTLHRSSVYIFSRIRPLTGMRNVLPSTRHPCSRLSTHPCHWHRSLRKWLTNYARQQRRLGSAEARYRAMR